MSMILGPDGLPLPPSQTQRQTDNESWKDSDAKLAPNQRHNLVGDNAHISEKVLMFPPAFMALKRELEEHHREWFTTSHENLPWHWDMPVRMSPAIAMLFAGSEFCMVMNHYTRAAIDLTLPDTSVSELQQAADKQYIHFDSGRVDWICHQFLNRLRKMRGLSPLTYN